MALEWMQTAETARREDVIDRYVGTGEVLDLGVVDSRRGVESTRDRVARGSSPLHEHIRRLNPRVVGVDIDAEGVELLRERGYDVHCADVETMDLGRRFDAIVAGEIIEHLPNAGRSLTNLRRHLKPCGHLILSTCNPFYARQQWKIWCGGDVQVHDEHTAWFDPHTLDRILTMSGYRTVKLAWLRKRRGVSVLKNWQAWLRPYFSPNFLLAATHADDASCAAA